MFPKFYNNNTLSTYLPTQKVATCQISSVKTKSIRQTNFSKFDRSAQIRKDRKPGYLDDKDRPIYGKNIGKISDSTKIGWVLNQNQYLMHCSILGV